MYRHDRHPTEVVQDVVVRVRDKGPDMLRQECAGSGASTLNTYDKVAPNLLYLLAGIPEPLTVRLR